MPSHTEHLTAVMDAFNAGEWDRMHKLVPPSAVHYEPGSGRTVQGEDYINLLKGRKTAFPDASGELTTAVEAGDVAVGEITFTGTHTGPLATADGRQIPASGNRLRSENAMVAHFEGDTLVRINHYFDLLSTWRQVGAA